MALCADVAWPGSNWKSNPELPVPLDVLGKKAGAARLLVLIAVPAELYNVRTSELSWISEALPGSEALNTIRRSEALATPRAERLGVPICACTLLSAKPQPLVVVPDPDGATHPVSMVALPGLWTVKTVFTAPNPLPDCSIGLTRMMDADAIEAKPA